MRRQPDNELIKELIFKAYYPSTPMPFAESKARIELITRALGYKNTHTTKVMASLLGYSKKTLRWSADEIKRLIKGEVVRGYFQDRIKRMAILEAQYGITYDRYGTRVRCWYAKRHPEIKGYGETHKDALLDLRRKIK